MKRYKSLCGPSHFKIFTFFIFGTTKNKYIYSAIRRKLKPGWKLILDSSYILYANNPHPLSSDADWILRSYIYIYIYTIIISSMIIILLASFSHQRSLVGCYWSLSHNKSPQVSRTFPSILPDLKKYWIISIRSLVSNCLTLLY